MLRNYIITALRNLKRNKVYTLLNVIGLALGIGCAMVIFKVITYELSFDKQHANFDRIYRVVSQNIYPDRVDKGQGTPHPVGPALIEDYSELEEVVRVHYAYGDQINITSEDGEFNKFLFERGLAFTENSYFKVFDVEWIIGDPNTALTEPRTVVITVSTAEKLFGLGRDEVEMAIDRLINYNSKEDFKVVGVIEDPVETTNFPFAFLFEYQSGLEKINPYFGDGKSWNSTSSNTNTYLIPVDGESFDPAAFDLKLIDLVEKYHGEGESENDRYLLQPMSDIHFNDEYGNNHGTTSMNFLVALGIIGVFLIVTACINFVNLATAQAANRAKEIGIRKAIGSLGSQLVTQFLSEISLITLIAVLISLAISELMFVNLEEIIGYRLHLDLWEDPVTLPFLLILFVLVSLLSGFYPSVLLSRMNAVMALKNRITSRNHSGGISLRKGLVILQFAITQFLIIGTLIVSAQMDYFLTKDLGFRTDAIITTYLPERDQVKMDRFRQEMISSAAIEEVTFSLSQPAGNSNSHSNFNYAPLESVTSYHGNFKPVDERFLDFYEIKLLAGRKIQKGDSANVVINQKIADLMGFKGKYDDAIGEKLSSGWGGEKTVVGVVEDFHLYELGREMDYVLFLNVPRVFYSISFKTSSLESIKSAIDHYESSWEKVYPEYVVDYDFYDEEIAERYEYEQNISALLRIFAIISILIGCLGLYGLISFVAINKTKEIGVRKVLGASVFNILGIFSREIIILMGVAFLFAAPLGYYVMNEWLKEYAYRIPIGMEVFVIAFIITLIIAIATISHRTISSALINPATTLKDE